MLSKDMGTREHYKFISRIWPRINGPEGMTLQIRVGVQGNPDDAISWGPYKDFVIGRDSKVDVRRSGRLISIEVRSIELGGIWRMDSFDIEHNLQGRF